MYYSRFRLDNVIYWGYPEQTTRAAVTEAEALDETYDEAEEDIDRDREKTPEITETASKDEFAEHETASAEEGMMDPETSVENVEDPIYEQFMTKQRQNTIIFTCLWFFSFILLFLALFAAFCFIVICRQTSPILGPDLEIILLVCICQLEGWSNWRIWWLDLLRWFGMSLLVLIAIRGLYGWGISAHGHLHWTLSDRISNLQGINGHLPERKLMILLLTIVGELGVALALYFRYNATIFSLAFLWAAILSAGSMVLYGKQFHHLTDQIRNLSEGKRVETDGKCPGIFAAEEERLSHLQQRQEEAIHQAITSERFKVELIANVSHDLRTPLTSIMGYGELLEGETLSEAGRERLERLNQKAGYMRDLVESLFELTKVSSGVLPSEKKEIDLIRLLEQTIGLWDDRLKAADLQLKREYETESLKIITDGARMHQVFTNLLGNAIKYALPGTRVYLQVTVLAGTETRLVQIRMLNVSSYEMDFQPEEIVQRFARGDKARSGKGSGIGLAIARTYTESVGGGFRVEIDGDQFAAIVELPVDI